MSDHSEYRGSHPERDRQGDYAFDPSEEFIGLGGRRVSRRRALATGGALLGAAAAGPLIFTKVDAEGLLKSYLKTNLPYRANTSVKGHVVLWHHYGSPIRHNGIIQAINLFKKIYKGVSVSDVGFGFAADWTEMKTRIAAGSGIPDVVVSDRPKLYYDGARHHFYQDVSDLVKRDGLKMSAFWPFVQRDSIINKKIYGLGWETDCRTLYHLRATFIDAGLKPDVSPKTWNDLKRLADQLDGKGSSLNGYNTYGGKVVTFDPIQGYDYISWSWTNKGDAISPKGKPQFNSAREIDTANWVKGWLDRYGGFSTDQSISAHSQGSQASNPMTTKNTIFWVDTPTNEAVWLFYDLRFYTKDGKRINPFYSAALLPVNTGGKPYNLTGGFDLSMPRKKESAAQRNATWEFMKFMSLVGQQYFAQQVLAIPSVQRMAQTNSILKSFPNYSTFLKAMPWGKPNYHTNDPSLESDVASSDVVNAMWRGDKSVKDTLNAMQQNALTLESKPGQ
ncbi:MAG TPA: extracellular solute-binding protein [Chloroflexota bacterium]|nr:extracellular solute-binding protein [Chloroflexota bacterium]